MTTKEQVINVGAEIAFTVFFFFILRFTLYIYI